MGKEVLKSLNKNWSLSRDFDVYANLNGESIATFHIVHKRSYLSARERDDGNIKCDFNTKRGN